MSSVKGLDYQGTPIWKRVSQRALRSRPWERDQWHTQLSNGEPLTDILIIDAHAHMGEWQNFFINQPGPDSMVAVMDRIGVRSTILAPNAGLRSDPFYANELMLQAVRDYPGRIFGYVIANPHYAEDMEEMLNRYLDEPGVVGIKMHPETHDDYPLLGPRYEPAWEAAEARGVPVLFHTYFGGDSLNDIAELAQRYPRAKMLVGHMLQDKSLEAMAELANTFPNLYVDLSVPETYGVVEFFVEALDNIEQLLFATDFPWGNLYFRVAAAMYSRLPADIKRKVMGENALKAFGIDQNDIGWPAQPATT